MFTQARARAESELLDEIRALCTHVPEAGRARAAELLRAAELAPRQRLTIRSMVRSLLEKYRDRVAPTPVRVMADPSKIAR